MPGCHRKERLPVWGGGGGGCFCTSDLETRLLAGRSEPRCCCGLVLHQQQECGEKLERVAVRFLFVCRGSPLSPPPPAPGVIRVLQSLAPLWYYFFLPQSSLAFWI